MYNTILYASYSAGVVYFIVLTRVHVHKCEYYVNFV